MTTTIAALLLAVAAAAPVRMVDEGAQPARAVLLACAPSHAPRAPAAGGAERSRAAPR